MGFRSHITLTAHMRHQDVQTVVHQDHRVKVAMRSIIYFLRAVILRTW